MQHIAEGKSIQVAPAETFVIERRGLDGSGFRTLVEVPDGVEHLGTRDPVNFSFGGRPKIEECFRCVRRGAYEIRFVSGRPWQTATHVVTTTATCR